MNYRYLLRRTAFQALTLHPTRQLSTLRPSSRVTSLLHPSAKSSVQLSRSFHYSRAWLAEEDKEKSAAEEGAASPAEVETADETVTTEPSPSEQEEIVEESIVEPEVADAAHEEASATSQQHQQEVEPQSQSWTDSARDLASSTAASASRIAQTARAQFPPTPSRGPSGASRVDAPPSKILYIGNLFFEVTAPQIESEFARHGRIVNVRVVTDPRGLSKGFAYVEFEQQSEADAAVRELDQKVFEGRRMAVQYHVRRERADRPQGGPSGGREFATPRGAKDGGSVRGAGNAPGKTLFIGNMSYQMSDKDLNGMSPVSKILIPPHHHYRCEDYD